LISEGSDTPDGTNTLPFKLNPDGETVLLSDPLSTVIDSIQYGRQIPNTSISRTDQNRWRLATPTPSAPNQILYTAAPRVIQLSEYLTQPRHESSTGEFVEIYNPSPLPVSMDGVSLSNQPEVAPAKQGFPALSFIEPESYLLLGENRKNSELTFGLSSQPAAIGLFSRDGHPIDIVSYGPQFAGTSEARDSNHELVFLSTPTPGLPNDPDITESTTLDISLIAPDHPWRFNQTGNDLGNAWRKADYNDQNWSEGRGIHQAGKELLPTELQTELKLGITTYYFRAQFDYDVLIAPRSAVLHFIADDGAIIYLNDQEIARVRMPNTSPINFLTQALENTDSDWEGPFPFDPSLIRAGTNVVAIEVHQSDPASNDVAFGLSLDMTVDAGRIDDVILSEALADNRSMNGTDWVEIFNPSLLPVDLSQTSLTDSLSRTPSWSFPPNTYITGFGRQVIHFNPNSPPSNDNTGFGLSASGDALYLIEDQDNAARIIDSITFGLQTPNISLARVGPDQHWGPAIPTQGSDNLEAAVGDVTSIRINEWLARASQGPDWFEIYNPGSDVVDLSGLFLSDDFLSPFKHQVRKHSFLGAGQHAWRQFIADSQLEDGADHVAFKLGGSGDNIAVFTAEGGIIDFVTFGPQASDQSEGLQPDGGTRISRFATSSPGLSNQTEQDRDLDGMEDEWERVNGLDPNDPTDAAIDSDDDELTNIEEFLLGTDPRSETSGLRIDRIEHLTGQIAITFSAIEGRGYALQKRDELEQANWENVWILESATQTGIVAAVVESVSGQAFYRLILR
ncbi:lamin tail domain-containing protein, partial [bacterium]|nr:lamin tail domain-containing protein [bacterium]